MPQPTPLAIATSSLQRLVKEEASYHSELEMQQKRIERLESAQPTINGEGGEEDAESEAERGNQEFLLKQESRMANADLPLSFSLRQRKALEETKAVFPRLRERIVEGMANLEALLASAPEGDPDVAKAREVIEQAKAATG
ncbi:hypothetical protein EPUS_00990 [Endocarpon pusillum Z07020]|uniref:Tubulin-specific chaperone A n=1 Tax=Endocarpon pusillum (strain Z07020 / HMAS-L-300199) TaxID=1263415 RepID=U1GP73_ENDPU|nr:uncharacterized protein EPUS_00990 [Endocarpon pusillum Z07020]ERF73736.1 hypothetical protein EPUS_00990 [Endocarpon pusillum Z07020]